MTTTSTFPKTLDTDSNLYRVVPADTLIPAQLNNKTDALEAIEVTIGVAGDGSEGGGSADFVTGLAHYVNFPSVAIPNPRFPWVPVDALSWYGHSLATPAGWTLHNGTTVAYNTPAGYGYMVMPAGNDVLLASCNPVGVTPRYAMLHVKYGSYLCPLVSFGWSVAGDGSDCDGVHIQSGTGLAITWRQIANGVSRGSTKQYQSFPNGGYVLLEDDGANINMWGSFDGICWGPKLDTWARVGNPTKFTLRTETANAAGTHLYLDMLAFGNTKPSGALA